MELTAILRPDLVSRRVAETCIHSVLLELATVSPESSALVAPQRPPLSYARLLQQVEGVVAWLHGMGVRRDDAVAIVLPSGPKWHLHVLGCAPAPLVRR